MKDRGSILAALFTELEGMGGAVLRNASLPTSIPDGGLVIMRDGEPGEPKTFIGGARLLEHYQHAVEVEIYSDADVPEAEIDEIVDAIRAVVRANRNLGGLVEAVTVGDLEVEAITVDDGGPMVVGVLTLTVHYTLEVPG